MALVAEDPDWWKGDLDAAIISDIFGFSVTSAKMKPLKHAGGSVACLRRLVLVTPKGEKSYVVKQLPESALATSLNLGLVRESYFFMWLKSSPHASKLEDSDVVACPFATCVPETGQKLCVLKDLSGAKEGRWLMMRSHPICANDNIPALTVEGPSPLVATILSFRCIARFHAAFWGTEEFKSQKWCVGASWLQGKDRELWEKEQGVARNAWKIRKEEIENGTTTVEWSENVVALVDASMQKMDWEEAQTKLREEALTLCHGDFWPANILFTDGKPTLVDWELVKVGSGRQDLGQFMMNVDIDFRRQHEKTLLEAYVEELDVKGVTFEETFEGYKYGGAAKICWILPFMVGFGPAFGQFFHDIAAAWFEDFNFTEDSIPQPRL